MEKILVASTEELKALIEESLRKILSEMPSAQSSSTKDKPLSVKEAAEYLNLAVATLYSLTSKRLIPFYKKGKRLYFIQSSIEKWVLEGGQKTVKEIADQLS